MLRAGQRAPAFDLPDLDGRRYRLQEALSEGPVLAVFWKPRCGTCRLAFPYFQRLTETYRAGWRLLAVSQDGAEATAAFARQYGLTFPVLVEGEGWPVSRQYDPETTPTLYLIARDGTIELTSVAFHKGELNEIARRLAGHLGVAPQDIAPPDDGNPPSRPG